MSKLNINTKKVKEVLKRSKIILVAATISGTMILSGCSSEVSTNNNVVYDVIDTTDLNALKEGLTQIIEVPDENFKLVVEYMCELQEGEKWLVTSDKKINMKIYTEGLSNDTQVYIDNIHTDTNICSYFPTVNGILQDTMDDRIHNSQMLGFPISNNISYIGINQIEGQNETFISGTYYGFNGYSSGGVSEERREESDYLKYGVYANKVSSIIDLIIIKNDGMRIVSVPSEIQVSVWPYIKMLDKDGIISYRYYYYNEDKNKMSYEEINETEFLLRTQVSKNKTLVKKPE